MSDEDEQEQEKEFVRGLIDREKEIIAQSGEPTIEEKVETVRDFTQRQSWMPTKDNALAALDSLLTEYTSLRDREETERRRADSLQKLQITTQKKLEVIREANERIRELDEYAEWERAEMWREKANTQITEKQELREERDKLVAYLGETADAVENPAASREEIAAILRKTVGRYSQGKSDG